MNTVQHSIPSVKSTIGPNDILEPGTKVKVKNKVGTVLKCNVVQAVPSGLISVHTIEYTHEINFVRSTDGTKKQVIVPIKKTRSDVNYSFIEVI